MEGSAFPLIAWTEKGLYCQAGGFYIDPHRAVDLAVVTHAHSDHARRGSAKYLCVDSGEGLLRARIGKKISTQTLRYRESIRIGDVRVSFHSAGHILGSAQVRVQRGSEVWVASGDYKRDPDPSCDPFESVPCDTFITEATFGTPKYAWQKDAKHGEDMYRFWQENAAAGLNSIIFGYSLGKGQRILAELAPFAHRPILIHSAMEELTECYRAQGRLLAPTRVLEKAIAEIDQGNLKFGGSFSVGDKVICGPTGRLRGELILAPPSVLKESWAGALGEFRTAFASGWMQGGGFSRYDHGFVLSDHADWNDLNRTIRESGASRVFVQHRNGALVRHLRFSGVEAYPADDLEPARYARLPVKNPDLFDFARRANDPQESFL